MAISKNALAVLEKRYLIRDEQGNPTETVDDLFHRVAGAIAAADRQFDPEADVEATAAAFYRERCLVGHRCIIGHDGIFAVFRRVLRLEPERKRISPFQMMQSS